MDSLCSTRGDCHRSVKQDRADYSEEWLALFLSRLGAVHFLEVDGAFCLSPPHKYSDDFITTELTKLDFAIEFSKSVSERFFCVKLR